MGEYTLKLSGDEMQMLIKATQLTDLRYKYQDGADEAAKAHGQQYGDLCTKIYRSLIEQDNA